MKIKVVKLHQEKPPKMFGISAIPERYQAHAQQLVNQWAHVLDRFMPVPLDEVVERIRFVDSSVEARVDADLLEEYAEMAADAFSSQGRVLYQMEANMLP